jgi:hypothetical protein
MSIRRGVVTVAGVLYALAWSAGSSADVAKGSAWSRGLALYKQSKFAAACPLLAEAATTAAENGAIWADLGSCELKRGDKAASIHASLLAARFGDERVRKNAYFNLHLAGYEAGVSGACGALAVPAELACSVPAFACTGDWTAYGSRSGTSGTVAVFDESEEDARARRDDIAGGLGGETRSGEVVVSESQLCFDTWCQLNGWRCEESRQVSLCSEPDAKGKRDRVHAGEVPFAR